jgi:hypothetical protein
MTVNFRSFSEQIHSPYLPIKEVALKEWAVCIAALAAGDQLILVRKGGVVEETRQFRLEETSFYLYPTYEHQRKDLIKESYREALEQTEQGIELPPKQVTITHAAHVVDDITVKDEDTLQKLDRFHILTHDYAQQRLLWQPDDALHILVVRAYKLTEPKTIDVKDDYVGCKSWITLANPIAQTDLEPVLSQDAFFAKRGELFEALGITQHS